MIIIQLFLQGIVAFLIGTLLYDIVHYLFHIFLRSKNKILKKIGGIHLSHHRFFPPNLKFNSKLTNMNLLHHVVVEYITQFIGTSLCFFFFSSLAVWLAILLESLIFLAVLHWKGIDPHHKSYANLPVNQGGMFVSSAYHALHHIYPTNFFSGYIKLLDYLLGTAQQLKNKRIALTGASGALGSNMKIVLEKEGAIVIPIKFGIDYDDQHYDKLNNILSKIDILFLCHGSKYENTQQANCDSFIRIIELFKSVKKPGLIPIEIWAVGSEIECHPCFGIKSLYAYAKSKRNFAQYARGYFHDAHIHYKHIVHSAFTSRMGPGLMSARFAARATLFLIKRGFKYVPVSYTGFAFLNYFIFIYAPKKYATIENDSVQPLK